MSERINVAGMSVAIGMPTKGDLPPHTVMSLIKTATACVTANVSLDVILHVSGVLQWGRDDVLDEFLRGDAQKLFWIDSDMVWTQESFFRLLALSTKREVVGASYPAKVEGPTTFYASYDGGGLKADEYGLMPVNGMGLGFTIIDRAVAQKLVVGKPILKDELSGRSAAEVFRFGSIDGNRQGEDMAFFADIRDLGYGVWMDPSIELGHVGPRQWRGKIMDALQATDTEYVAGPANQEPKAA